MRCKAGRTGGPADEDFELSGFYHFKQGAAGAGGDEEEDEKQGRMENIQPVLAVDFCLSLAKHFSHDFRSAPRRFRFRYPCVCFGCCFGEIALWKRSAMTGAE